MFYCKRNILSIFIIFCTLYIFPIINAFASDNQQEKQSVLRGGWYHWDPYQYLKIPADASSLTGLDIQLQKLILKKAGYEVSITPVSWRQHQEDLKTGSRDYAMGAFYSDERAKIFHIPEPYRFEENSLFVMRQDISQHKYKNVEGFLEFIKTQNLKVGVVEGYRYASDKINKFIEAPENRDVIIKSETDDQNLNLLLNGRIDAFLADRIVGATIIWRQKVGRKVTEKQLNSKAPIYMLLSKKSISEKQFQEINKAIIDIKKSPEYVQTVSWYLYPILLLETTDSDWFTLIEIIGIIAFALSGLVVAYRCNASLFGTFILAFLPSFGGGVLRDVIFGRYPVWFMQAHLYMLLVIFVVIVGFITTKLLIKFGSELNIINAKYNRYGASKIFDTLLTVTDAIGLAAFTVTGVLVSLIVKADPLWLWGPFFAFLTGAGGGMLRDIVVKEGKVGAVHGEIYPEIALVWGLLFSLYLTYTVDNIDPVKIEISVIVTIVCAFLTRILIYFNKVPNIHIAHAPIKPKEVK